ncbi:helix-turn-helix domain-containing protein [Aphanothece sacrum]|uniref:DNA-binding helix-turn-helix protein n=1 Tax=Aphanothece sacrum FPU1 TaxID=1920663 RepID=A0A401IHK3_APHSA|nr:transcriptional regulator [Aphanothece sacrum]GBF80724.1 DNA-binding helix-turn-helix protein [Aphanothece sacrum FPU1]GBF83218.1 DNA-binding helix-turn-helix protein [Aphanothece sacrum FPU3]
MFSQAKYLTLLKKFPPRPIKSEKELDATQEIINELLDKPELTLEEKDYLDILGTLIYEYEQELDIIPDIYGVELLKFLLEDNGLKSKDFVLILRIESIVSDILNGKRQLTTSDIQALAAFFNLSPDLFLPIKSSVNFASV